MAEKAEQVGVVKARLDTLSLLALAVLAGAFIALGSAFSFVAVAGAEGVMPYGVTRLLGGLAFSLGLVLVIVGEHSIANMFGLPAGLAIKAGAIGGVLVGITYWFVYLRRRGRPERGAA